MFTSPRLSASQRIVVHEIAKALLEQAGSLSERMRAVETAMHLGMPLAAIEEYLDWLDAIRPPPDGNASPDADATDDLPENAERHQEDAPAPEDAPPASGAAGDAGPACSQGEGQGPCAGA